MAAEEIETPTRDFVLKALYGNVEASEFGLLVTLGEYTTQARAFARSKANLRIIDGAPHTERDAYPLT